MRTANPHHLVEKMDEDVTHFINSHQSGESVHHVDAGSLALNVQDDSRVVVMQHSQGFTHHMTARQIVEAVDGPWNEELIEPERLAALVAQLSSQARVHHQSSPYKVASARGDVDASVVLDARLFNGQTLDGAPLLDSPSDLESSVLCASPSASGKPNKKSLPHKKRISRRLKRNTPQSEEVVVINPEEIPHEEIPQAGILPDTFETGPHHLDDDTHPIAHIANEMRAIFICQLCGEFYGSEQLKFFQHLKQHYEPHHLMMDGSPPVPDLAIDKMTNTCIVDNGVTLPDSIVELSLENTVPKTMYQTMSMDKHILYTTGDKTMYSSKVQYSMASMDKDPAVNEVDKTMYELDKLELYSCFKCSKQFRRQRQCEAHIREAHPSGKLQLDDMSEFSEPEDLMEGIHVAVEEGGEQYDTNTLPHLTVDSGHVHQEHPRHWYMRCAACAAGAFCAVCPPPPPPLTPAPAPAPAPRSAHAHAHSSHADAGDVTHSVTHNDASDVTQPPPPPEPLAVPVLKEDVLRRILESEARGQGFAENMIESGTIITEVPIGDDVPIETVIESQVPQEPAKAEAPAEPDGDEPPLTDSPEQDVDRQTGDTTKRTKQFVCPECDRVFFHRNSLLYHLLSHQSKQHACEECGKDFYTPSALKVHIRVHNGDRPYKCEECEREFRQWSDLKYHQVSLHSQEKAYKCEFCSKEFARKYSLSVHRRIHTGERNYKCPYCDKSFRTASYRQSHVRTHTGDRPYQCEICEKRFRVTGDLRRHQITHDKMRNRSAEKNTKEVEKTEKIDRPQRSCTKKASKDEADIDLDELEDEIAAQKNLCASGDKHTIVLKMDKIRVLRKNQSKKDAPPNYTVTKNTSALVKATMASRKANVAPPKANVAPPKATVAPPKANLPPPKANVAPPKATVALPKADLTPPEANIAIIKAEHIDIDTKQLLNKFDKVYNCVQQESLKKDYAQFKDSEQDREFAVLKPILRGQQSEDEKPQYSKVENTDGKIFIEKNINLQTVTLNDLRNLERERGEPGEPIETGFLERLTALYNIPA